MGDFCRRTVVGIAFLLLMTSCSPFLSKKPPIILILVESFSEQNYLCADPRWLEDIEDFKDYCSQFLRFTHSFAPSTMSQPVIASLMSGVPVSEHGVIHNGALALSGRFQTLAEHALNNRMRTIFVSGGVPLMRKFGITQGFEVFDDSFSASSPNYFRPFLESIKSGLSWIDDEVGKRPFLMTFYVPDLLYSDQITVNDLGRERPRNRQAQLQEFHESMFHLVKELKSRNLWDQSHVILLGLGGETLEVVESRALSSSMLQVPLQVKLAQGIESNLGKFESHLLSFSQIGQWLQQLVFHKSSQGALLFSAPTDEPFIPLQSDWLRWQGLSSRTIYGLRRKQYLFTFEPELSVFDTFADRREVDPIPHAEALQLAEKYEIYEKIKNHFADDCLYRFIKNEVKGMDITDTCISEPPKYNYKSQIITLNSWSQMLWTTESKEPLFESFANTLEAQQSLVLQGWIAYSSMAEKSWDTLIRLGKMANNNYWSILGLRNKGDVFIEKPTGCLKYFINTNEETGDFYKHCESSELRKVVEGLQNLRSNQRPMLSFWEQVHNIKQVRKAKLLNIKMNFTNDIHLPFEFSPTLAEMYFYLPENLAYQKLININEPDPKGDINTF